MSEETPSSDAELSREFSDLVREERLKVTMEGITRRAIRGFEILLEKNIYPEMPLSVVRRIIDDRCEDLRKNVLTAKPKSVEWTETMDLLSYLDSAYGVLENLKVDGFDQETRIDVVLAKLKGQLKEMEDALNEDEDRKRGR